MKIAEIKMNSPVKLPMKYFNNLYVLFLAQYGGIQDGLT